MKDGWKRMQQAVFTKWWRRLIAFCVAALLCVGIAQPMLEAATYYIEFYDTVTKVSSDNTTVVENSNIRVRTKLPAGYQFSATPFSIRRTGSDVDVTNLFTINSEANNNYTLTALNNSADGGSAEYTIQALYTANITEGAGNGAFTQDGSSRQFTIRAVSYGDNTFKETSAISITEESSLTFTTTSNQPDTESAPGYSTVSSATGNFKQLYEGQQVYSAAVGRDSGGRFLGISVRSKSASNPTTLYLKMYISGLAANQLLPANAKFTITFTRQYINTMILTVITPQIAVDGTAKSIQDNPTDPDATVFGTPYIKLARGDALSAITENFTMMNSVHRHNVDIDLSWEWQADNSSDQDRCVIKTSASQSSFEIVRRPQEDIRGQLIATATYISSGQPYKATAAIPIYIYGTGVPPSINYGESKTGNPGQTPNPMVDKIDKAPTTMDVYQGDANTAYYTEKPWGPFSFDGYIDYGASRGMAASLVIKRVSSDSGGLVDIRFDGSPIAYNFGDALPNEGVTRPFIVTATQKGSVTLRFEFYNSQGEAMRDSWFTWTCSIHDMRPSDDATLQSLRMTPGNSNTTLNNLLKTMYPDGYDYSYDRNNFNYSINVPNAVEQVSFTPQIPVGTGASKTIGFQYDATRTTVNDSATTAPVTLTEGRPTTFAFTITAQSGAQQMYTLTVTRAARSLDSSLSALSVRESAKSETELLAPVFNPATLTYDVSIPYGQESVYFELSPTVTFSNVRVAASLADGTDQSNHISPASMLSDSIAAQHSFTLNNIRCDYDKDTNTVSNNVTLVTLHVTAEQGPPNERDYVVRVTRQPPSNDQALANLYVQDNRGNVIPFSLPFDPTVPEYAIEIPYSTESLSIYALPNAEEASHVILERPSVFENDTIESAYSRKGTEVNFRNNNVKQDIVQDPTKDYFEYTVRVRAESGNENALPYRILVTRLEPNTDTRLASMAIVDGDGADVPGYTFNQDLYEYDITVPYITDRVFITPVVNNSLSVAFVGGQEVTANRPTITLKLDAGVITTVRVTVRAESGAENDYVLRLTRSTPSSEARLSNLQVNGQVVPPRFIPGKGDYTVTLAEDVQSYTVTPTAIDGYASIKVDGKSVASGTASEPIVPTAATTTCLVEVTAQNGVTKMTYTLTIIAEALIEKSNNADLESLTISDSYMTPVFKAGVLTYEASIKPETKSVDIVPKPANEHATVVVTQGSKQLGDHNGNYATAITGNETPVKVTVTSQDKSVIKEYAVTIYQNTEGKEGIFKPITADMVDYETSDPIIVDISTYPIVAADVFNTLKEDYPDKTIVFMGNDYSLECMGSDLQQLVPNTETFDFSLSFVSPEAATVDGILAATGNAGLEYVYVYFTHHGALPANMKFTLSLGSHYGSQTLYWNYYNTERNRIDYYGPVRSNAQGTFTVPLNHMSTYIVSKRPILGAENRVGMNGALSSALTTGKINPTTGLPAPLAALLEWKELA